MKNNGLILALTILFLWSCGTEQEQIKEGTYKINLKFNKDFTGNVKLCLRKDWKLTPIDSGKVVDNMISFTGSVSEPEVYVLLFSNQPPYLPIYVENSVITAIIDPDSISATKITGSISQTQLDNFSNKVLFYDNLFEEASKDLETARKNDNEAAFMKASKECGDAEHKTKKFVLDYIMKHNSDLSSAYILASNLWLFELEQLKPVVESLSNEVLNSKYGKEIEKKMSELQKLSKDAIAPNFILNDTRGNPVSLSDFRGKYVLIDFWASWCKPCREENPNVLAAFKKYNKDGFTVLGVSLDASKKEWLAAIEKDHLIWTNVSDYKSGKNAIANLYEVRGIPSNVLIDKEGIIIAKKLRGQALQDTLEHILR